jgi:hypothetical protein
MRARRVVPAASDRDDEGEQSDESRWSAKRRHPIGFGLSRGVVNEIAGGVL